MFCVQIACKWFFFARMNTSVVVSLDTRRAKKDGSYPLILRMTHNRDTIALPIGISIPKKDWDENARSIKRTYTGVETVSRLNNLIQKKRSEAMDIIVKLHEQGELDRLSVVELKARIHQPTTTQSFIHFSKDLISDLEQAGRFGTAKSYKEALHVLIEFNKQKDLSFKAMTYDFLNKFENAHIGKGNSYNSLAVYMRTYRSIYNKAIKSGLVERELYPFETYKIRTVPTEKRALDWELLKKIILLEIPEGHRLFNARNFFVASYMMYGMNFSDMASLKKSDIKDGRILYRRKKTSKLYDIKITEALKQITDHYLNTNKTSEFLFPILRSNNPDQQYKEVLWARKRYNKKLKDIAKLVGIENTLTSYVSRHSFATQAMMQQVPLNAISAMLGHSNIKTTEIYLKSLPSSILDDYNSKILSEL